jgi:hypothetical protein
MAITLREGLGRKLTIAEMDENFVFLSGSYVVNSVTSSMVAGNADSASVAARATTLSTDATASIADTATTASHTAGTASIADLATLLSADATASFADLASVARTATSASIAATANSASVAARATELSADATASFADLASDARTATSASFATQAGTSRAADSASVAARATTLSAEATASFADVAGTVHDGNITTAKIADGNVTNIKLANDSVTLGTTEATLGSTITSISGLTSISATTGSFVLQLFESSSTIIHSGSNVFGDENTDIQQFTGSLLISGSGAGNGSSIVTTGSINISGSLGVGTAASGVVGAILATNDVVAFASSDERLKENVEVIGSAVEKVEAIGGYTFDWIPMEGIHVHSGHDIGVIAQEIEAVLPELVTTRDNGYKAVKYEKLTAVLIQAVKELSERVKVLEGYHS